jgi:16S rRNA (cytidine1402-2'-O)-methyltransferase
MSFGKFVVSANHIGNIKDIPRRAAEVFSIADYIISENPVKLISSFEELGYSTNAEIFEYNGKTYEDLDDRKILNYLENGKTILFMVERGLPGLADPGAGLINRLRTNGVNVIVIPGPGIAQTLHATSGLNYYSKGFVVFETYNQKTEEIKETLKSVKDLNFAVIVIDRHVQIKKLLNLMLSTFEQDRQTSLCIDLSLDTQEVILGTYTELIKFLDTRVLRGLTSIVSSGADFEKYKYFDKDNTELSFI